LPLLTRQARPHHGKILSEATLVAEAGQLSSSLEQRRFTMEGVAAPTV
jgi:hypothetical protein